MAMGHEAIDCTSAIALRTGLKGRLVGVKGGEGLLGSHAIIYVVCSVYFTPSLQVPKGALRGHCRLKKRRVCRLQRFLKGQLLRRRLVGVEVASPKYFGSLHSLLRRRPVYPSKHQFYPLKEHRLTAIVVCGGEFSRDNPCNTWINLH